MTVQNVTSFIEYTADGIATSFAFTFRVDDADWLTINYLTSFDDTTLNADQDTNPGGSISYLVAPPDLQLIRIERSIPLSQELDYTRYDPFDSEAHETALDKLTMQIQDTKGDLTTLIQQATNSVAAGSRFRTTRLDLFDDTSTEEVFDAIFLTPGNYIIELDLYLGSANVALAPNAAVEVNYSASYNTQSGRSAVWYFGDTVAFQPFLFTMNAEFRNLELSALYNPFQLRQGIIINADGYLRVYAGIGNGASGGAQEVRVYPASWIRVTQVL